METTKIKGFTEFNMKYIMALKTSYGHRIYELSKASNVQNQKWNIKIEELTVLLGCEDIDFDVLKNDVLEIAIKDINEHTDMKLKYEIIGETISFHS